MLKSIFEKYLIRKGFDKKRAHLYVKELLADWKTSHRSFKEKLWAARRGFFASKIDLYHLTESNYKDYLSDYQRLWLHPINNHFAFWINDKITLKYVLQSPFVIEGKEYDVMPEYYLYIENDGHYSYLMDSPVDIPHNSYYLLNLLKRKGELAVKLSNGAKGVGFYHLEYKENMIWSNDSLLDETEFESFEKSLKGYIITEYVHQHKDFNLIWDKSEATLRIITIKNNTDRYSGGDTNVITSFVRFGTSLSSSTSNMSAGGVGIAFSFSTGEYGDTFYREPGLWEPELLRIDKHPDNGMVLKGLRIPDWEVTKEIVYRVCEHLSSLEFMGIDIIITDNGPKIIEINSLPAMDVSQCMEGPIFQNQYAAKYFNNKIAQKSKK